MNRAFHGVALLLTVSVLACKSERRDLREVPPAASADELVPVGELKAGGELPDDSTRSVLGTNAYALGEGQTLYHRMNCVGCHSHGGGGIGPALMDSEWIYGSDPAQIFKTIIEGRPNGMPAFRGKLGNQQVWQLVAYVRSMSGFEGSTSVSAREDHMFLSPNRATRTKEKPGRAAKTVPRP
jgi:cytochrome c oxidase cbb3-type subunit III